MKIVLLGAGNVAHHLGPLLRQKGHSILQVYSPSQISGKALARKTGSSYTSKIDTIISNADFYLLAIKDEAITTVIDKLSFIPSVIAHTSGPIGMDVFPAEFRNSGVLYPLQTFSKESKRTPEAIPFCIEARNKQTLSILRKLSKSIGSTVEEVDSEKRQVLHVAAVFVNNFTNYLFTLSSELLKENKLDFALLLPLIQETVEKLSHENSLIAQSGPARRGDKVVMKKQLDLLKNNPRMRKVYALLSKGIEEVYHSGGKIRS